MSSSKIGKGPSCQDLILNILSNCTEKSKSIGDFKKPNGLCELLRNLLFEFNIERTSAESILVLMQALSNRKDIDVTEYLWNTGLLGLVLRAVFQTDHLRSQGSFVNYLLWNSVPEIAAHGKDLLDRLLPLDFTRIILGTNRESASFNSEDLYVIKEELSRLTTDYSESAFTIWSEQNTEKARDLIEEIHFEKAAEDPSIIQNISQTIFSNDLLEGETISCGVILRIYNKTPTIFLRCKNEHFLKTLLSSFESEFKQYLKLTKFINKHLEDAKKEKEEEEKNLSENDEEELDPGRIVEYKNNQRRLIYNLTLYLTSVLLNIKANSENLDSDLTYTERTALSLLKDYLEELIPELFDPIVPCLLRYTFMQVAILLPDLVGVNQLVEFLQSQKENG